MVRSAALATAGKKNPRKPPAVDFCTIALAIGPAFSPNLESIYSGLRPYLSDSSLIIKSSATGGSLSPPLAAFNEIFEDPSFGGLLNKLNENPGI